jgi:uncharacterized Zn-binding protein involved in type VI secretion
MPGKPAARMGDPALDCGDPVDAPTGTVIAASTVFINKLPAAKKNDQVVGVDIHIIMIPSPGGPIPTPLPNPFTGIINGDCESTVKIMGMPAAVVGSTADNTPPHLPLGGPFQKPPTNKAKIMLGSPNVFIGSGSGGGSGGGSGSVSGSVGTSLSTSADSSDTTPGEAEGHYLDANFIDSGKRPVFTAFYDLKDPDDRHFKGKLAGRIKRYGVSQGTFDIELKGIVKAAWSAKGELKTGDEVMLKVETKGIEDGDVIEYSIWERDINRTDKLIIRLAGAVQGNKGEASWIYEKDKGASDGTLEPNEYSAPSYYFIAETDGIKKKSGILGYTTDLNIKAQKEEDESPLKGTSYVMRVATGEFREGTLDSNGKTTEKDLPPKGAAVALVQEGRGKTEEEEKAIARKKVADYKASKLNPLTFHQERVNAFVPVIIKHLERIQGGEKKVEGISDEQMKRILDIRDNYKGVFDILVENAVRSNQPDTRNIVQTYDNFARTCANDGVIFTDDKVGRAHYTGKNYFRLDYVQRLNDPLLKCAIIHEMAHGYAFSENDTKNNKITVMLKTRDLHTIQCLNGNIEVYVPKTKEEIETWDGHLRKEQGGWFYPYYLWYCL